MVSKVNFVEFLKYICIFKICAYKGFPGSLDGRASAYSVGDLGSIPGSGRSPAEGNGNPLQYSRLENPMDQGAWWTTVHGVTKSQTRLSDFSSLHIYVYIYRGYKKIVFSSNLPTHSLFCEAIFTKYPDIGKMQNIQTH